MKNRALLVKFLLFAMLVWALAGCGGDEEAPPADNISQTKAMVPDSIIHDDETEPVQSDSEAPPSTEEVPVETPLEPVDPEPVPVVKKDVAPVSAETAPVAPIAGTGIYSLQLGAYTVGSLAEAKAAQLRDLGYPGTVEQADVGGQLYHRVFIRGLSDRESAEKLGEELHTSLGLSYLIRRK